jgi:phospholipase C
MTSSSGGTWSVKPASTTTYTATATGPGGTTSSSVTVTVTAAPPPTVTISANPASISPGGSSLLTVTANGSTQVTVTGTDGSNHSMQASSGGTLSVSPAATTTYTATATGPGGTASAKVTVEVISNPPPAVTISANPGTIMAGNPSTLTVTASNATEVTVTGTDGSSYSLSSTGGAQQVSPASTTTYTATATGNGGTAKAEVTVTVTPEVGIQAIDHVIFMLQENHTFDNYFGMLNPYREKNHWNVGDDGNVYDVDGIDDKLSSITNNDDEGTAYKLFKLKSTCVDDMSSDWLASYGDVNRYDFTTTRGINMDGFVHDAEGFAKSCNAAGGGMCSGSFTDTTGERAMGYYDENFLNYYYYMASQFALSDRWFSPVSSKSVDNRIAAFTGGTTQGLTKDPGSDDHLDQLSINNIFEELDTAKVSWKIYYTVTIGFCTSESNCSGSRYPATFFSNLSYSYRYLSGNSGTCTPPKQPSSVVGDSTNSFCIDPTHIAPLSQYFTDLANGTLPSFAFIEAGYGNSDEHPGSGNSVLVGQVEVAKIINALMTSSSWKDSVFFFSYDEGGGPYDHVPPVSGHSNDFTDASLGSIPDISSIAVNPDSYNPCLPPGGTATTHCDLESGDPGAQPQDAAAVNGFAAQLGFRLPNFVVSPFARKHYVSHIPMDHTAVIKFVEDRFIGSSAHLTARDAAQPDLLNFFNFNNPPWLTPPTPPAPVTQQSLGYNPCTPADFAP